MTQQETQLPETRVTTKDTINYLIAAALFIIIGALLSVMLRGNQTDADEMRALITELTVDESELRAIVAEVVAEELAALPVTAGGGISEDTLRAIVAEVVAEGRQTDDQDDDDLADDDPFWGVEDAPVTIVEFSDFLCGFCGRHFQQTIPLLRENYGEYIRYVYRDFPGVGGQRAVQSAIASHCADDQGRFWDYHALLFNNQSDLSATDDLRQVLLGHAETLELDMDAFTSCLDNQTYLSDVNADRLDGQRNGVSGTPTFFINGIILVGAQPYENFVNTIEEELDRLGIERENPES